jgi:hypothetical protein
MSILKKLRERTEPLNVAELAQLLNVTEATVQRWVSAVILNGLPLIYFVLILWCLNSGEWTNGSLWAILLSIFPAFAPFGFYRIWTGCVELWRERFYGVPEDWTEGNSLPPEWQAIGIDLCPNIDLNPAFAYGNLIWGLVYVIVGVIVALFLRCS